MPCCYTHGPDIEACQYQSQLKTIEKMPKINQPVIILEPAQRNDVGPLAELRVLAMRASLERVGRFDAVRAVMRFTQNFDPVRTRHILSNGQRIGFLVVRNEPEYLMLDHLYVHPNHQGQGAGALVLGILFSIADPLGKNIRVGALRGSDSNQFYLRHGFELAEETEWDNHYVRKPAPQNSDKPQSEEALQAKLGGSS